MVRWLRWHCPPDTGIEIRALAVWGRARYLSVTEAPHNTNFHTWMGKKQFCFFQTAETGNRTPDSGVKGSGANHYPGAPALRYVVVWQHLYNNHQVCVRNLSSSDRYMLKIISLLETVLGVKAHTGMKSPYCFVLSLCHYSCNPYGSLLVEIYVDHAMRSIKSRKIISISQWGYKLLEYNDISTA